MEKRTDEMEQILKKILEMDEDGLESFLKMLKKREDWYLVCMNIRRPCRSKDTRHAQRHTVPLQSFGYILADLGRGSFQEPFP